MGLFQDYILESNRGIEKTTKVSVRIEIRTDHLMNTSKKIITFVDAVFDFPQTLQEITGIVT
jgi:hypothetical protein